MKKIKSLLTLTIFFSVISTICPAAGGQKKIESNWPTAQELLDKCSQSHQDMSFIVKMQVTSKFRYDEMNWGGIQNHKFEERYDGNRSKTID